MADLRALPKAELHRHLEGAVRLSTILDEYRRADEDPPATTPEELSPLAQVLAPMEDLEQVLSFFRVAQATFRDLDAVERISYEAVIDLDADNVRLAELRYSPDFLCRPGGLDWDEALTAIEAGIARARAEVDVEVGLIAVVSRSYGMGSAEATVAFALRHLDRLIGFDLADGEAEWPPSAFVDVLAPLREARLPLTAHYGEATGPEYPAEAIERLGVRRLGHGVSVAHDPEVTALAIDRGVALEMCPTSNVRTGAVPSIDEHPALRLLREGARVTINTDDPGLFDIDLTHELAVARDQLGFDLDDLRLATSHAIEASFLSHEVKDRARRNHFGWLDR